MANDFSKVLNPNCRISVGANTRIGDRVVLGPSCEEINIGFGCFVGNDIYIDVKILRMGDYVTVHHGSVIHGVQTVIGHNCWIGQYTIVDSLAGLTSIGNNVGVGAHSQLWSHMKFGDVLEGCRWCSSKDLIIEDDVWFVGHSIVGPIHAAQKSMLMTGSVIVSDMAENSIYAGSPAKDMTQKFGRQFVERTLSEKMELFLSYVDEYRKLGNNTEFIHVVEKDGENWGGTKTAFSLLGRCYWPRYTEDEFGFMKYILYEKAKFLPVVN